MSNATKTRTLPDGSMLEYITRAHRPSEKTDTMTSHASPPCPLAELRHRRKQEQAAARGQTYTPTRAKPTGIEVVGVLVSQPPESTQLGDHGHVYVAKYLSRCDTLESLSWKLREAQQLIGGFVRVTYRLAGKTAGHSPQWTLSYGSREEQP